MQHNVGQVGEKFKQRDLNVEPAWMQGFTGNGVVVGVIDDGESSRVLILFSSRHV